MRRIICVLLTVAILGFGVVAGQAGDLKKPVENGPDVIALIDQGISLHDAGKYEEAVKKYKDAIKLNPDNPLALYEIAFSYEAMEDHQSAYKYIKKAAEYDDPVLAGALMLLGNIADLLGKPEEALEVYDRGLKLRPNHYLILYNKGYTYTRMGEDMKAIDCLKKAISSEPNHPSSHAALAQQYERQNYRIPSILAYCRFFILEPNTQRTTKLLPAFQRLLTAGVEKESDSVINVNVSMEGPDFDGDFTAINLLLSLSGASRHIEENKDKHAIELIYEDLNTFFSMIGAADSGEEKTGFVWEYYAPYFGEMYSNEYVRPFVYFIFQLSDDPAIQSWLTENEKQVDEFLQWSAGYKFKSR